MLADGYTALPRPKLAALVTFLERDLSIPITPAGLPEGLHFERLGAPEIQRYRALYRGVGQDWLWFSRLQLSERALAAIIGHEQVHALALRQGAEDVGLLELDFRENPASYLAFFGLTPGVIGAGLGRAMMAEGLMRARASGARMIEVNTCTLDHPKALEFYLRSGFVAKSRSVEVFDDPRLSGVLPQEVARHIPIIRE
jgi:GNAT superfamily N-acetyltransferase